MAARYDNSSKIDPELRGTVDFDFFESEDFEKSGDGDGDKNDTNQDYYYDDDDDFESDDEDSSNNKHDSSKSSPSKSSDKGDDKKEKKDDVKPQKKEVKKDDKKGRRSPLPERSDSPTPRASKHKSEPRKRRDSVSSSSGSDITEVSPLQSTDNSPKHSNRDQKQKQSNKTKKEGYRGEENFDMDILMDTIMKLEKDRARQQKKNVMFIPPKDPNEKFNPDKNYSFERHELEEIERENHRLLHRILHQHQRGRKTQTTTGQFAAPPCKRQYHSALNRQKEQRRIEQENLKILHRLQTVKPSKEISRNQLLKDSRKQAMYGIPVHTMKQRRRSHPGVGSVIEEDFDDAEWQGESQMTRMEQDAHNSKSNSQTTTGKKKARPSSGKKPQWNDRW